MIAKVAKNRCAKGNPYVETTLMARFGVGIDKTMELIDLAIEQDIIEKKAGGNYRYVSNNEEEFKWRGAKSLMDFFDQKENAHLFKEISNKINQNAISTTQLSEDDISQLEKYNNDSKAIIGVDDEVAVEDNNEA